APPSGSDETQLQPAGEDLFIQEQTHQTEQSAAAESKHATTYTHTHTHTTTHNNQHTHHTHIYTHTHTCSILTPTQAMDFLAIGVHELANISERRIERLCNPSLSELPAFLV